jgi:hypothetical protein
VNEEDVLLRLRYVPVSTWNMKGVDPSIKHLGPVAEDFYKAFPLGIGNTTIGMSDIDGVNLAAAKALDARTKTLQSQVKARDETIAKLEKKTSDLEARIEKLEELLKSKQ